MTCVIYLVVMSFADAAPQRPEQTYGRLLVARTPRMIDRLRVWIQAPHLDAQLAEGTSPESSSALAVRARRLLARQHRDSLARSYRRIVRDALEPRAGSLRRIAPHRRRVRAAITELVRLADTLAQPGPVSVRGVAQAQLLLADGAGPLYAAGADSDLCAQASRAADELRRRV